MGLAFERICLSHIEQIKAALGISQIGTEYYSWRSQNSEYGAQIDLIIERADRIINIFEIKYSEQEYSLQKEEFLKIQNRVAAFKQETGTRNTPFPVLVTTFGLKKNEYASSILNQNIAEEILEEAQIGHFLQKDTTPFYFSADDSKQELDFILQMNGKLTLIEVKAEENLRAKSLRQFVSEHERIKRIRISMSKYREQDWMTNIPLYAAGRVGN